MSTANLQTNHLAVPPFLHPEDEGQTKTFRHNIDICLKDSNAYGNTYFSRYFEWQGVCREQWFFQCICEDMLQSLGVLITKCAHQDYAVETFPFQKVECLLNSFNVKHCSFGLLFRFYVGGKLVSRGYQQIVFANHDKKIIRFPEGMRERVKEYEDSQLSHLA